ARATRLPLAVQGMRPLRAIAHTSPVASAQVKSAVLLAGLYADGPVSVHEPASSRDHSERMLRQFGARLRVEGGGVTLEPGDLYGAELRAARVGGPLVPRLIDELPALAVAAVVARGATTVSDAAELRVKESDRIATLAREFGKMGVRVEERPDGMVIEGPQRFRGARVASGGDHRMAMALVVAGLVAEGETVVEDTECVRTSFPGFVETLNALAGGPAVT